MKQIIYIWNYISNIQKLITIHENIKTKIVKEKYKPEKIILYDLSARETITENNDIDLPIVKETDKKRNERFKEVRALLRDEK